MRALRRTYVSPTPGRLRDASRSFWERQLRARISHDLRGLLERSSSEPLPEAIRHALMQMEQVAAKDHRRR